MKRHDLLLAATLSTYTLLVVAPLLTSPSNGHREASSSRGTSLTDRAVSLTYDDGFYYLRVAQHLAAGHGSTFDGLHETNGYHPLWLTVLVGLALLTNDPDGLLLSSMLLQMILAALTTFMIFRTARLAHGRVASILGVMVWVRFLCSYWMPWSGLEYALHAAIVTVALYLYLRWFGTERGRPMVRPFHFAALGTLLSLALLARLDNILLALCLGLAFAHQGLFRAWSRDGTIRALGFALPVLLTVSLYVGLNLWAFGHPFPVSGSVKAAWSAQILARDPHYLESGFWSAKLHLISGPLLRMSRAYLFGLFAGTLGTGMAALVVALRPARAPVSFARTLAPFAVFAVLQLTAYGFLFHGAFSFQPWCYVVQPWLAAMGCAWVVEAARTRARRPRAPRCGRAAWSAVSLAALLACLGSTGLALRYRLETQRSFFSHDPSYELTLWVREHLDRQAAVGAWNAGMLSYLSRNPVVNLDGLINSWSYHELERSDLCGYLEATGITYLADVLDANDPIATLREELEPCLDRLELVSSEPGYPGTEDAATVLRFHPRHEIRRTIPPSPPQPGGGSRRARR